MAASCAHQAQRIGIEGEAFAQFDSADGSCKLNRVVVPAPCVWLDKSNSPKLESEIGGRTHRDPPHSHTIPIAVVVSSELHHLLNLLSLRQRLTIETTPRAHSLP